MPLKMPSHLTPRLLSAIGALLLVAVFPCISQAAERIEQFHSDITINGDGSVRVNERVTIFSEGKEIKRGIMRHIPTRFSDGSGKTFTIGFQIESVQRDGKPEKYRAEESGDGQDIWIGDPAVLIPSGKHVYDISYTARWVLGHFEDHDELYWDTTGTQWGLPIESASAAVHLPAVLTESQVQITGFTGPAGSEAKDFISKFSDGNLVSYFTTRRLGSHSSLTIVVGFPKGLVTEPEPPIAGNASVGDSSASGVADPEQAARDEKLERERLKRAEGVGMLSLGLLAVFYWLLWMRVGRDPKRGPIYMQAEPPEGLSPAAMRYLRKRGDTAMALPLALMSMAQKGVISISEDADGDYSMKTQECDQVLLSPEEVEVFKHLFGKDREVEVKQTHHARFSKAQGAAAESLKAQFGRGYFSNNESSCASGCALTMIGVIVTAVAGGSLGSVFGSPILIVCTLGMIGLVALFSRLLPAYSRRGREILDKIEGYKLVLTGGDPEMSFARTPEQAARFGSQMAYAVALDVQSTWARMFTGALEETSAPGGPSVTPSQQAVLQEQATQAGPQVVDSWFNPLRPSWYHYGGTAPFDPLGFSNRFHSHFTQKVSHSCVDPTPPSSSSSGSSGGFRGGGSSGFSGGSSGGGRGGGGGKGW